ncbi:MAG: polyprenyl synthetase family protein [Armatimonadota bacterium]|nr:polyprenyl synthetase family protein [Armatimonadota bacterium]MDR7440124.1 polyprenyl synthetase family protein [Armatimonadota bacterium]MDR7562607.1 polyprenyl synthetase family protein [Armatimonadota bacterium]MDR7568093.1 polyprenyl synthetase family protein [Armatimonadota bacterium]MDR7602475.1 polyprenyl synthetase family protein [Armatimonadota bacterium]
MAFPSGTEAVLERFVRTWSPRIEEALDRWLPAEEDEPGVLHRAIRHSIFGSGKRFRPLLVLASSEACGLPPERALRAACAVEAIHTYSLIHDDLPSMDNADLRRGRPTCHVAFGEAMAILAGDALHALAFCWLVQLVEDGIPPDRVAWATREVSEAIGPAGMVGGQVLDLLAEQGRFPADRVGEIHRRKTGALIRTCARLGPILSGSGQDLDPLTAYGEHLGLAFQIADDILDAEEESGLPKATYPRVFGLEESRRLSRMELEQALQALEPLGERAEVLRALARFAVERAW